MRTVKDKNQKDIKKGDLVRGYQYQGGIRTGRVNIVKRDGRLDVGRERAWIDPSTVEKIDE